MRLLILRHGATRANDLHRYAGRRTDEPLSERGVEQCRRAGVDERVRRVYASPMLRALQTARLCFPNAEVVPVPGLEEFDFGDFEGRSADQMADDEAYRAWVDDCCRGTCPGGESRDDFARRTRRALDGLLRACADEREGPVVVVAHGGTVMAALDGFYDKSVGNCEGYVATVRLLEEGFLLEDARRFGTLAEAAEVSRP